MQSLYREIDEGTFFNAKKYKVEVSTRDEFYLF